MRYHSSPLYLQQGSGLGRIFASIFSKGVIPLLGKVINLGRSAAKTKTGRKFTKSLTKAASDAGLSAVNKLLKGKSVASVATDTAKKAHSDVMKSLDQITKTLDRKGRRKSTRGQKRRRRIPRAPRIPRQKRFRRQMQSDIFSSDDSDD